MRLENATGAPAFLHTVDLLEPELRTVVIVKRTYAWAADGSLQPSGEQLPLIPDQLVTDFGQFHGDLFFRKRGIDVCVLGTARFDRPVRHARVRLEAGSFQHELALTGDRFWTRGRGDDLAATAPAPFQEMPLSYTRAFGGIAQYGGEDVPWADNPTGRGYYEAAADALGKPLPNIEPVGGGAERRWDARIPVAGWGPYPMFWGLRSARSVKVDSESGEILDITPEVFNQAHPDLILETLDPGTPVRVTGVRPAPLWFNVPRERPRVEVRVGDAASEALGEIDGVYLWIDAARVVVTWRARFRYAFQRQQIRRAVLTFVE